MTTPAVDDHTYYFENAIFRSLKTVGGDMRLEELRWIVEQAR